MKPFTGCFIPKKGPAEKLNLLTLCILKNALNKKAAGAIITGEFFQKYADIAEHYFDVKIIEAITGNDRPALDEWTTDFIWNKDEGNIELLPVNKEEPHSGITEEPEFVEIPKSSTNPRAALLVLFGHTDNITRAEYSLAVDLTNDDEASPEREMYEAITRLPRVLSLFPDRQIALMADAREKVQATAKWPDYLKFMEKWLDTPPEKRDVPAEVKPATVANTPLASVGSREMAAILEEYIDEGKKSMAKHLRSSWTDIFKEAQFAGEVPPGFNPVQSTRKPKVEVTRARLQIEDWLKILEAARVRYSPWAFNALRLALVTGQRLSDILHMQFKDVKDGYLFVVQGKTGSKIALPLSLRCEAAGLTLEDVINGCRDHALSPYLVHHCGATSRAKAGKTINKATASTMFARCREDAGIITPEGRTPVSFHEQRSLAERLYEKQGINTQKLLGHKTAAMTQLYHDERDDGWAYIAV